ncbi:cell cycle histidine kinase CckA [Labrys wisconsinensis]|uniref:histidine kinase n=1 Tax=Labrys wisconsinensis TaxID=425677 RepID=A0ABU0JAX0_9HYPH|nr:PAS domain-containing protein [Labrys wisconsinensis]MDQ0471416.1 two-component system cell cycle sensor histidine kinase/response regulator CckA [Labrys wisconsinensis]
MANGEGGGGQGFAIDRSERASRIKPVLVVVLAAALLAALAASTFLAKEQAESLVLGLLAILAAVGVVSLCMHAFGFMHFGQDGQVRNDLTKAIADGSPEGLVVTDKDGRVVYANAAYLAMTGATGEQDVRPVERAFTGDPDVSEPVYRLAQAARGGQTLTEEFRIAATPPAGGASWYRVRVRPMLRASGARDVVWTVADITRERERQENAFLELQHAIDYLDHAPAGFFSADPSGEIAYMNATLAGWLDFDLAQFGNGGLKLTDILPGNTGALIAAAPGEPGSVKTEIIDVDLRRRNGTILPVRLFHKVAFSADGHPGASRTLVIYRGPGGDVSEGLRAAEVRFARFFNNSPLAIATVDKDGRVIRTNAAFMRLFRGAFRGEAQGSPLVEGVAEREREGLGGLLKQATAGHGGLEPLEATLAGEAARSARFWFAPVDAGEEDREAAIVYVVDTTEQRALQEQFAQSQKMQAVGQLAGGVAHDFNNVLGAIMLAADFLIASHGPGDPAFQDIMSIKSNANRAANLVRQLLAFSRRQTLRPQVLNLNDAVSDLSLLLRRLLGEKVALDVVHGRDLWPVKADVNQFEQVVMNLAVNARDSMANGGKVLIRTRNVAAAETAAYEKNELPRADYVVVEVEDSGTGIPAAIMDKIFEPFFTTKEVGKGTGLGLSTVYGIVKQTGGWILVDSVEGKGTTFRIFLPRHVEAAQPAAAEGGAAAAPAGAPATAPKPKEMTDLTGRGRILLVEDEEALRALSARTLVARGFEVIEASSGIDALQLLEEAGGQVDLVVSDVVMPEMDGPTLLKELRKRNTTAKIIFVSGYAEEAFERNMPQGEVFAFLPKPFSMKQLVEAVKSNMVA